MMQISMSSGYFDEHFLFSGEAAIFEIGADGPDEVKHDVSELAALLSKGDDITDAFDDKDIRDLEDDLQEGLDLKSSNVDSNAYNQRLWWTRFVSNLPNSRLRYGLKRFSPQSKIKHQSTLPRTRWRSRYQGRRNHFYTKGYQFNPKLTLCSRSRRSCSRKRQIPAQQRSSRMNYQRTIFSRDRSFWVSFCFKMLSLAI